MPEAKMPQVVSRIYRRINDTEILKMQKSALNREAVLKFDVTVLLPYSVLGKSWRFEFPKTTGHFHKKFRGFPVGTPDFYQIAFGDCLLFLHKFEGDSVKCLELRPKPLEPVLIPPGIGHTAINTGKKPLVFCNVCVRHPHLDYAKITRFHGAPFFFLRGKNGKPRVVENREYARQGFKVQKPKELKFPVLDSALGAERGKPIYNCIGKNRLVLKALLKPQEFPQYFEGFF